MGYKQQRPIIVSEGGTGNTSLTIHSVLLGNSTSAITQLANGTTGQILTAVTGLDPAWAAPAASSISITGNTGGALTGAAFTFSGGTTGLSFGGSGTTETLTFAGITVGGGAVAINSGTSAFGLSTDASATTVSIATGGAAKAVTIGSTTTTSSLALKTGTLDFSLASATGTIISALDTGEIRYALQPAFLATLTNAVLNVTGDGTTYKVIYDNEIYDQNSDFTLATSIFTAPITGRYHFCVGVSLDQVGVLHTDGTISASSANRDYKLSRNNIGAAATSTLFTITGSFYADMDAADTVEARVQVSGSTKTIDMVGDSNAVNFFSGMLAC